MVGYTFIFSKFVLEFVLGTALAGTLITFIIWTGVRLWKEGKEQDK